MFLTLALVVVFASILVIFAQEFIRALKKLFAIKGVALFLPLLIASWLVYTFDYWALWIIYYYREMLHILLGFLIYLNPFPQIAEPVALVILLEVITVLPVFLADIFLRKRTYIGYQYPYLTSTLIFIVSSMLLLAL